MSSPLVSSQVAMFYSLLEAAAADPKLGGNLGVALNIFFNRGDIKARWISAPASTAVRFHHAYDGGLVVHTVETFRIAQIVAGALGRYDTLNGQHGWMFSSTPAGFVPYIDLLTTVALHDLSKIGDTFGESRFVPNMIKNGTVRSDKIPYETSGKIGKFMGLSAPAGSPTANTPPSLQALYLAEEAMEWVPDGTQSLSIVRALDPSLFSFIGDAVKFAIIHHDGAYGKARRLLTGNETPLQMIMHFADMWSSRMNKEEYRG